MTVYPCHYRHSLSRPEHEAQLLMTSEALGAQMLALSLQVLAHTPVSVSLGQAGDNNPKRTAERVVGTAAILATVRDVWGSFSNGRIGHRSPTFDLAFQSWL